jgi:hypothetical protein
MITVKLMRLADRVGRDVVKFKDNFLARLKRGRLALKMRLRRSQEVFVIDVIGALLLQLDIRNCRRRGVD